MKKTEKIRLSGSIFAIAQKCPASLTVKFSKKLMSEEDFAQDGKLYVVDWKTGPMGIEHLSAAQIDFYAFLVILP